jgi:hypothetical protein
MNIYVTYELKSQTSPDMESQFVPPFNVFDTTDYPLRLSADSIIRFEILTRPDQRTDLDLPDKY